MKMNRFRPLILLVTVVAAGFLAYGFLTRPGARGADSEGFLASEIPYDIEKISEKHHSVAHPEERAEVRNYLVGCLNDRLKADTVRLFEYDSLVGPQNKHVEYTFDAVDILAEFAPSADVEDPAYLMFVAHYDSRYSQPMPKDTVWSYGAADDGYGVGVILQTVEQALKFRKDWKQGVKVLFTDAEEVGMMGMKAIWENDRHVFDNVGFVINVEARGPWGPALLFETSPGNERVMELYKSARYPFTYSLTTVVYTFMPNFTDFTIIKDEIPGMNFSTIVDVNHYHTDLDNFGNISEKTIQHYGDQILPVTEEYLTNDIYSDRDYLKAEDDTVNFTVPGLGLFNFSKAIYMVLNVVVFVLFLLVFGLDGVRGRVKAMGVFRNSLAILGIAVGVLAIGELLAYVCALISGAKFKLFGVIHGIFFDNVAMIVAVAVMFVVCVLVYMSGRKKAVHKAAGSMRASAVSNAVTKHADNVLYGALALMLVLCAALLFTIGENLMFLIPLACASVALVLYRLTSLKVWNLLAIALILLHAFSFLHALAMALTIGAFGAVAMLAFLDMMVLIPLADLYMTDTSKRR